MWRFILASAIPVIVVGFLSQQYLVERVRLNVESTNQIIADSLAREVRGQLRETLAAMNQVAGFLHNLEQHDLTCDAVLDEVLTMTDSVEAIYVLDNRGRIQHIGLKNERRKQREDYIGLDLSHRPLYKKVFSTEDALWSDAFLSIITGKMTLTLSIPCDERRLVANLYPVRLTKVLQDISAQGDRIASIIDRQGIVVFHPDIQLAGQKHSLRSIAPVQAGLSGTKGTFPYHAQGREQLGSVAHIPEIGWLALVSQDKANAYAAASRVQTFFLWGMLCAVAIAAYIALWQSRQLAQPFDNLSMSAGAIASGDYEAPLPGLRYNELESLGASFRKMSLAVRDREKDITSLAENIAGAETSECFDRILIEICRAFNAETATVGELTDPNTIQILAMHIEGVSKPGFSCDVTDSPCAMAARDGFCLYENDVREHFPHSQTLRDLQAVGYVGIPLRNQSGECIGILNAFSRKKMSPPKHAKEILAIIAARASAEIERRSIEQALNASTERYQRLVQNLPVGIDRTTPGPEGQMIMANKAMVDIFGYESVEEILSATPASFYRNPEDRILYSRKLLSQGRVVGEKLRLKKRDGSTLIVSTTATVVKDESGKVEFFDSVFEDITEQEKNREELERFGLIIEQSAENIVITDTEGTITYVNPAFEKTTGYSALEAVGEKPSVLKSGEQGEAFYSELWETISAGDVWKGCFSNKKKDGTLYLEEATITPIRGASKEIVNYVAVKRNITRETELERQLLQAQKMEAVGQLAGGVAHDFNNLLQVISGYGEMTLADTEPGSSMHSGLSEIMKATQSATTLVRQLLAFSRQQVLRLEHLDLDEVVRELSKMIRRIIGEDISFTNHAIHGLRLTQADRGQMEQILLNLCVNARDAMSDGGKLSIETSNAHVDEEFCRIHSWARPGHYVCLSVTDTGCGMDEEQKQRIFEPFYTTKELGKGTGLGMSTVYGIVKQHKGMIHVYSELNLGTTFKIYLPEAQGLKEENEIDHVEETRGGSETILMAEDDDMVHKLTRTHLENAGYRVLAAIDGKEAVALFDTHMHEIDLVLLDVVMPFLGGRDVHDHICAECPGMPIIFASGYSTNAAHTNFILDKGMQLLQKPYTSEALLGLIRERLDQEGAGST
jgi:PAS domain S-box-containing protein